MDNQEIVAINISVLKGTQKKPVPRVEIDMNGIVGDAHAGTDKRQISLLPIESIEAFSKRTKDGISHGDFAENLIVSGIDFKTIRPGDRFRINSVELEVTQIGKSCHGHGCRIYVEVGDCIMPKEGVFTVVRKSGEIKVGDSVQLIGSD